MFKDEIRNTSYQNVADNKLIINDQNVKINNIDSLNKELKELKRINNYLQLNTKQITFALDSLEKSINQTSNLITQTKHQLQILNSNAISPHDTIGRSEKIKIFTKYILSAEEELYNTQYLNNILKDENSRQIYQAAYLDSIAELQSEILSFNNQKTLNSKSVNSNLNIFDKLKIVTLYIINTPTARLFYLLILLVQFAIPGVVFALIRSWVAEVNILGDNFKTSQNPETINEIEFNLNTNRDYLILIKKTKQEPKNYIHFEKLSDFFKSHSKYNQSLDYIDKAIKISSSTPILWQKKADILNKLKRYDEELQSRQRFQELHSKVTYKQNLSLNFKISYISISQLENFQNLTYVLNNNVNLLLGKNGFGKSYLMKTVLSLLQDEVKKISDEINEGKSQNNKLPDLEIGIKVLENITIANTTDNKQNSLYEVKNGIVKYENLIIKSEFGKIPVLAIPDSRFINKSIKYTIAVDEISENLLDYSSYHFIYDIPYEGAIQNLLNSLCNIYFANKNSSKPFEDIRFKSIQRIFYKLTGKNFEWKEIVLNQRGNGYLIKVRAEGSFQDIPIQKISQGTLSIISMIGIIYQYLALRYINIKPNDLQYQSAIVFIDEIDAHLHPSWQQKIIGILREEFPNIQFIISAHNPLIIAGCLENEVSVLRQTEYGFTLEQFNENFIGISSSELYSKIFEIEDIDENYIKYLTITPEEIQKMASKKLELITKEQLNSLAENEITELNKIILLENHLNSAKKIANSKSDLSFLETENILLRTEIKKLQKEIVGNLNK